jgi:hypothetical protein
LQLVQARPEGSSYHQAYFSSPQNAQCAGLRGVSLNTASGGPALALAILISPLLLLSKSRRHYLTVSYLDEDGRRQALVFQVHKEDVRSVLASLSARTGLRVEYQDEEARKTGGGG